MRFIHTLLTTFSRGGKPGLSLLLQSGFVVTVPSCGSVRSFLLDSLHLSHEFIDQVIQSVFLDGKPVDNLDEASVKDGCTLALSAAMPGLVGATLRRGGYYSCMRSSISHREDPGVFPASGGEVTVKLFNLIAAELGPALLACGIRVKGSVLRDFLESQSSRFQAGLDSMILDGRPASLADLKPLLRAEEVFWIMMREA